MLDVRALVYVSPIDEQEIGPIIPVITLGSYADEDCTITGLFRIYRDSTGLLEYSSVLHPGPLAHGTAADFSAETAFNPGAIADDDYFVICQVNARSSSTGQILTTQLGPFYFDTKAPPMGPVPAGHASTHEDGGMDEITVAGLSGLLADPQTPALHAANHGADQADEINVTGLLGELFDDQPALAHDIAGNRHTSAATPGQLLQADADGLPEDATNTDADVASTVLQTTPQTLTDGAAIDWDLSAGGAAQVTLGGDRTLNAPTNMVAGQRYRLKVIQDGTGTRLLTWNAIYRFPGGVHPCLTAAINTIDILIFDCDGTYMDCVGMVNAQA